MAHANNSDDSSSRGLFIFDHSQKVEASSAKKQEIIDYRQTTGDSFSSDEQIKKRLDYLESLFRNIIRAELQNYLKNANRKV